MDSNPGQVAEVYKCFFYIILNSNHMQKCSKTILGQFLNLNVLLNKEISVNSGCIFCYLWHILYNDSWVCIATNGTLLISVHLIQSPADYPNSLCYLIISKIAWSNICDYFLKDNFKTLNFYIKYTWIGVTFKHLNILGVPPWLPSRFDFFE